MRRKNVVVAFFDTIQNDVVREIDRIVQTEPFQKRLAVDRARDYEGSYLHNLLLGHVCVYLSTD
jgi:hypothetical protein